MLYSELQNKENQGMINFDIGVTTSKEIQGYAGGKAKIMVVNADLYAKLGSTEQRVSRISFSVHANRPVGHVLIKLRNEGTHL